MWHMCMDLAWMMSGSRTLPKTVEMTLVALSLFISESTKLREEPTEVLIHQQSNVESQFLTVGDTNTDNDTDTDKIRKEQMTVREKYKAGKDC